MRKRLILYVILSFSVTLTGLAQRIQINDTGGTLSLGALFDLIEDQSEYTIFYNVKHIDINSRTSVSEGHYELFPLLETVLSLFELEYILKEKLIIIVPQTFIESKAKEYYHLEGIIQDVYGESLPGTTILVENANIGFSSGPDGRFSIDVPAGSILHFSFIGKKDFSFKPDDSDSSIIILLEESILHLEDVVITGVIGETQKNRLGFTVDKIMEDQIKSIPGSSVASVLSGRIPGIKVSSSSAAPGSQVNIQLRGATAIFGGSNPLVIIDGVISEGSLSDLNSEDISAIEIIKGSASSSLYGSRAANGVINIISRRGNMLEPGTTRITYRSEAGQSFLSFIPRKTSSINVNVVNNYVDYSNPSPDGIYNNLYPSLTDPVGSFFDPGYYKTDHFSFSSNSKDSRTSLYGSLQYTHEKGVVNLADGMSRYNFRINADHRFTDRLSIKVSSFYSESDIDRRADNIWDMFYYADPDVDLMALNEEDGSPYNVDPNYINPDLPNPLYMINNTINSENRTSYLNSFGLKYRFDNNIELAASYGLENINTDGFELLPKGLLQAYNEELSYGSIYKDHSEINTQNLQAEIFYSKRFGKLLSKFKLQYLYESNDYSVFSGSGSHLAIQGLDIRSLDQASENINISSYQSAVVAQNISGVLYFDYNSRYIIDMLVRQDGVSLFGRDERWKTFYRISGAWRITEDFTIPLVDELKLRASYGVAGLRPTFEAQYEIVSLNNGIIGAPVSMGNSHLSSSFSKELEIGLDVELARKIDFSFVYSKSDNSDQILQVPVSATTGFSTQWQNAGRLESRALEASLGIKLISKKNLKWNLNLMWDNISQKVVELNQPGYSIISGGIFRIEEGVEFGTFYGRRFAHSLEEVANQVPEPYTLEEYFVINNEGFVVRTETIGTVDEEPVQILDDNGNYLEDIIGSIVPDFNLNMASSLVFHNFSLNLLLSYQQGGEVYNHMRRHMILNGVGADLDQTGKNGASVKSAKYYVALAKWNNDHFVEDASFLKAREITVSYNIESKILKEKIGLKNMELSIICYNPFIITRYSGFDPETGESEEGVDSNVLKYDLASYPTYTTLSGCIKLTF